MTRLERGLLALAGRGRQAVPQNAVTAPTLAAAGVPLGAGMSAGVSADAALRLSAVSRCVEVLSDSMGKLPMDVIDRRTRRTVEDHWLSELLTLRPNEQQTPFTAKKALECACLLGGNGVAWILRDPRTLRPTGYLPIPHPLVTLWRDDQGGVRYTVVSPLNGEPVTLSRMDVLHVMGYSKNGWSGVSVLSRAAQVVRTGEYAQAYSESYYANGGQPSGVLQTEADLSGDVTVNLPDGTTAQMSKKDLLRREWERRHGGPTNAQRVAILDYGLKYVPLGVSNRDAQFVEQAELSVQDISRFFGVPLYKLQAGKQSYASNEQHAIEYVVGTIQPKVTQWEEEWTYKLLPAREARRYRIRINMMAELRGDFASRAQWFRTMREIGGYSVNDILALEDLPDVEGGDERYASLNYVPLSLWHDLSVRRNEGGQKPDTEEGSA